MVSEAARARYAETGYAVAEGLFSSEEVDRLRDHFMALRAAGRYPGDFEGVDPESSDPLKKYPRMIHMQRWDEMTLQWLTDDRLNEWLTALLGVEPFAVQTMLYYKPAGARGQALHQDQFYLRVQPGTCMAAWLALDPCDEENGCMQIVPGTHALPVLCTETADTRVSFTDITVPLPSGMEPVSVLMNAGDVLFFNGSVVHGSLPNRSKDRFRRTLIGHYIAGNAERVSGYYHPVLRMDGSEVDLGVSAGGSECGVWREVDGAPAVEMTMPAALVAAGHE